MGVEDTKSYALQYMQLRVQQRLHHNLCKFNHYFLEIKNDYFFCKTQFHFRLLGISFQNLVPRILAKTYWLFCRLTNFKYVVMPASCNGPSWQYMTIFGHFASAI